MTWDEMRWHDMTLHCIHTHIHISIHYLHTLFDWYGISSLEMNQLQHVSTPSRATPKQTFLDIRLWINHPSYGGLCRHRCQSHGHLRWLLHFLGWAFPFFMAQYLHPPVSICFLNFDLYFPRCRTSRIWWVHIRILAQLSWGRLFLRCIPKFMGTALCLRINTIVSGKLSATQSIPYSWFYPTSPMRLMKSTLGTYLYMVYIPWGMVSHKTPNLWGLLSPQRPQISIPCSPKPWNLHLGLGPRGVSRCFDGTFLIRLVCFW